MIAEINVLIATILFIVFTVYIGKGIAYRDQSEINPVSSLSDRMHKHKVIAIGVYELSWIYLILSLLYWIVPINPNTFGLILFVGIGFGIVIAVDMIMTSSKKRPLTGSDYWVERVEYEYRKRSEEHVIEVLKMLEREANVGNEIAKVSLEILSDRGDSLGVLVKSVLMNS